MLFSRAGLLTDPNMDPHFLAILTSIAINKAAYEPTWEKIKAKYFEKFRGKGGEGIPEEGEVGLRWARAAPGRVTSLRRAHASIKQQSSSLRLSTTTCPSVARPPSPSSHGHQPQPHHAHPLPTRAGELQDRRQCGGEKPHILTGEQASSLQLVPCGGPMESLCALPACILLLC